MKRRLSFFSTISSILLLSACNFSVGSEKDLDTGISFNYKGFRVNNVFLVDSANQKLTANEVPLNARIGFLVYGLSNYSLKNGEAFPGMTVEVLDKQGYPVVGKSPDLFAESAGLSVQDASVLLGSIKISAPMKAGGAYHLKAHVWDKNNPGNILDAEADITVK
ncbi:hypothetical protein [Parafilimonas sp.]|uniref:hypothetical protein n=1 Tax=Parafilimonas sp. TaxID=1969739 RepID=UPI0039E51BCA